MGSRVEDFMGKGGSEGLEAHFVIVGESFRILLSSFGVVWDSLGDHLESFWGPWQSTGVERSTFSFRTKCVFATKWIGNRFGELSTGGNELASSDLKNPLEFDQKLKDELATVEDFLLFSLLEKGNTCTGELTRVAYILGNVTHRLAVGPANFGGA